MSRQPANKPSRSGRRSTGNDAGRSSGLAARFWERWNQAVGGHLRWAGLTALRWQGTLAPIDARIGPPAASPPQSGEARLWVTAGGQMRLQIYWPQPHQPAVTWVVAGGQAYCLMGEGRQLQATVLPLAQRQAALALAHWGLCGPVVRPWIQNEPNGGVGLAFVGERGGAGVDRPVQLFTVWQWRWPEGIESQLEVDRATGLPAAWRWRVGAGQEGEIQWSEYRRLQDLTLPFQLRLYPQVGAAGWKFDWELVEIDPPLPETLFMVPGQGGRRRAQLGVHREQVEIPVRWAGLRPYVQARVNGRGPFWFAVELGQEHSAVWNWVLASGPDSPSLRLEMPELLVADWPAHRLPDPPPSSFVEPSPAPRQPLGGWIGLDVWRSLLVELDGPGRCLRVWNSPQLPAVWQTSGVQALPLEWRPHGPHALPTVLLQVGEEPVRAGVQSSAGFALAARGEPWRRWRVGGNPERAVPGIIPRVVAWAGQDGGPTVLPGEAYRLPRVRLGPREWVGVWAWSMADRSTPGGQSLADVLDVLNEADVPEVLLGGALLQTGRWLWDFVHGQVYLAAGERSAGQEFSLDAAGVRWEQKADGSIWAAAVVPGSAAWLAGVRPGQRLATWDGVEADNWSVLEIEESVWALSAVELDVWPASAQGAHLLHLALQLPRFPAAET
ncbi:MAG: hypothetical protein IMX01_03455 [Limnochordaceae bacterium]|nr:hypothetical protein [Limnochordaceae bacterium]